MSELNRLLEEARGLLPAAIALRRRIHQKPELGLDLPLTTEAVIEGLNGLEVGVARGPSTSGLIVTLRGAKPGRTILLRGDMDALPMPEDTGLDFASEFSGRMHACGHDSHTAMLVQAVHLLHRHRDELSGTVKFMFQPGEEGYGGARLMIQDGLLDADPKPDAAFALHIWPNTRAGAIVGRPGPILASADAWTITIKGRGGHASMPHDAIDPIPVAFEIGLALQAMVTRRIDTFDPVVLTCTKLTAGTTNNVIPEIGGDAGYIAGDLGAGTRNGARGHSPYRLEHRRGASVRGDCHRPPGIPGHCKRRRFCRFRPRCCNRAARRRQLHRSPGAADGRRRLLICPAAPPRLHDVPRRDAGRP